MALTLTIGGLDFMPYYVNGSMEREGCIQHQGDYLKIKLAVKTGATLPMIGSEIVFKDGATFIFGGFVTKLDPTEYGIGQLITYDLEATDYTYLLINKTAQKNYAGQTLKAIITDIISSNLDVGYGITTNNVETGPIIDTIAFNHITLRKCLENLAKITNFIWWIDYQKDIHFLDPNKAQVASEKITDSSGNIENINITLDITQVRNDVVILGGTQESTNYQQVILGDANAREWILLYPVQTMVNVELSLAGGAYVVKTFGVDPKDDETSFFSMYNTDRGSIRLSSVSTTLGTTDKLRVTFTYPLAVISEVQDAVSIVALKAVEGGDGIHTYTINDTTILSSAQAQQRALKELAQFSMPILNGIFVTHTSLLQAGSIFEPGQVLTVNLPSWGISIDTNYIIQKIVTTMVETGASIEYTYTVTFGGRMIGVVDFLLALGTPEEPLDTSGEVQIIKAVAEVIAIAEVITRDGHLKSMTEIVTTAESISKVNFTPPFKWGAFKWGEAEWS